MYFLVLNCYATNWVGGAYNYCTVEGVGKARDSDWRDARQREFNVFISPILLSAYRFAYSVLLNAMEAEDAVQDSAMMAWQHFDRYDRDRPFQTWYFTILANNCRSRTRSRWWSVLRVGSLMVQPTQQEEDSIAERSDLVRAIAQLPSLERSLLVLRYYHDASIDDIAAIVRMSPEAVRSRMYRALRRLRPRLLQPEVIA